MLCTQQQPHHPLIRPRYSSAVWLQSTAAAPLNMDLSPSGIFGNGLLKLNIYSQNKAATTEVCTNSAGINTGELHCIGGPAEGSGYASTAQSTGRTSLWPKCFTVSTQHTLHQWLHTASMHQMLSQNGSEQLQHYKLTSRRTPSQNMIAAFESLTDLLLCNAQTWSGTIKISTSLIYCNLITSSALNVQGAEKIIGFSLIAFLYTKIKQPCFRKATADYQRDICIQNRSRKESNCSNPLL